ncbi:MAG: hypothetical protein A9Z00_03875 [Thermobacillus sp. ZCTH02-B1]|nr:MAG: hypothetical protein A9Z00_03875 [Thermobacillus sp. ZCTH02-B1]
MRLAPLLAVLLLVASCGRGTEPAAPASGGTDAATETGNGADGSDPAPQPVPVKYYVTNEEMRDLIEKQTTVLPAGPGEVYRLAIEALRLEDEAAGEYSLWKHAEFRRVEMKDGVLTVDLALPDEARLGSMGEALALEAITRTAFQFDEVEALDILVDGERVDSLMGHVELAHPIPRNADPFVPDSGPERTAREQS